MKNSPFAFHGGDTKAAEATFGRPRDGWIDLSTGINPFHYPIEEVGHEFWTALPSIADETALRMAAAKFYDVRNLEFVVSAPGTQSLIQWLARLRPAGRVVILEPTYSEHAIAWRTAGHMVRGANTLDDTAEADVVIVVNPNNPTGRHFPPDHLAAVARRLNRRRGWLIVDEAFAEVWPSAGMAPRTGERGLIVLRSFGKFFGLAGIRLGFALAPEPIATSLRRALGPWAVGGPAVALGTLALADEEWVGSTRRLLQEMGSRLHDRLTAHGLAVIGGTALFKLVETPDAVTLHHHLAAAGILTRPFPAHPYWLRFGLPGPAEAWRRLESALETRP